MFDSNLYTLPIRDKGKRLSLTSFINLDDDRILRNSQQELLGETYQSFLEWLLASHPTRAGPNREAINLFQPVSLTGSLGLLGGSIA